MTSLAEGAGFAGTLLREDPEEVVQTLRREPTYEEFLLLPSPSFQLMLTSSRLSPGFTVFVVDELNRPPPLSVLGTFARIVDSQPIHHVCRDASVV
jgi:hypothetical protein